jgi:hypothetical protein
LKANIENQKKVLEAEIVKWSYTVPEVQAAQAALNLLALCLVSIQSNKKDISLDSFKRKLEESRVVKRNFLGRPVVTLSFSWHPEVLRLVSQTETLLAKVNDFDRLLGDDQEDYGTSNPLLSR